MKKSLSFLILILALNLSFGRQAIAETDSLVAEFRKEFQQHNYKKVIQIYKILQEDASQGSLPLDVRVRYGQSLAATGEIDEAISSLNEILLTLPAEVDPVKIEYDLANLLYLQKRHKEAAVAYRKVLWMSSQREESLSKARERLASMKEGEGKKSDLVSLQLLDIETALDSGDIPEGSEALLKDIMERMEKMAKNTGIKDPDRARSIEKARALLGKMKEIRTEKASALLNEARRLFDEEKKYAVVREILEEIQRDYGDVCEAPSVEALVKAVASKIGKANSK